MTFKDEPEDDRLFLDLRQYVAENFPNPERVGCFDAATLETMVFRPRDLDLSDPKYLHVFRCAECTRDLIILQGLREERGRRRVERRRRALLLCVAAGLCLLLGFWIWGEHFPSVGPRSQEHLVSERVSVDLSTGGPSQGDDMPISSKILLPKHLVNLHLVLPYSSPTGKYSVAIVTNRGSSEAKVSSMSIASTQGGKTELSVFLDLRVLSPDSYYLSITQEKGSALYYYPVTIQ